MNAGARKLLAARQDRYRLTDRQAQYLRSLLNESFARGYDHPLRLDPHHLEGTPRTEASAAIKLLCEAKAPGLGQAMSDGGFAGYDVWKCTEPAPEHPDPLDPHDDCERAIERLESEVEALTAEIALRDRRIEELEIELAACKEHHP